MKVIILPSSAADPAGYHYLTSFLIDGTIAVDAGSLGLYRSPLEQSRIQHVFLTHSHADHVGSLPVFLENTGYLRRQPVIVHGSRETLASLERDVFNDRVWPALSRLGGEHGPVAALHVLEPECSVDLGNIRVTSILVNHVVPTFGFLVENDHEAVVFGGDSGPTDRIWDLASATNRLRAAFLECTFPDELEQHAQETGHLCPRTLAGEMDKLPSETDIVVVHLRPAFRHEVKAQLLALALPRLRLGQGGAEYEVRRDHRVRVRFQSASSGVASPSQS